VLKWLAVQHVKLVGLRISMTGQLWCRYPQVPWIAVRSGAEIGLLSLRLSVSQGASLGDFLPSMVSHNLWTSRRNAEVQLRTDDGWVKKVMINPPSAKYLINGSANSISGRATGWSLDVYEAASGDQMYHGRFSPILVATETRRYTELCRRIFRFLLHKSCRNGCLRHLDRPHTFPAQ